MTKFSLGIGLLNEGKKPNRGNKPGSAPTAIALSATAVPEDAAVGATVATISADGTAPVAFAIAADPDGKFAIVGAELRLAAALDHETKTAHQVTIRATNAAGSVDQAFTIAVTDVAEATAPPTMADAVAFQNNNTSSHTLPLPGGIQAGDLLVIEVRLGGLQVATAPIGWTLQRHVNNEHYLFSKIADGNEGGSVSWTLPASNRLAGVSRRFSNAEAIEAIGVAALFDAPSLTPSWGTAAMVWVTSVSAADPNNWTATGAPSGYAGFLTAKNSGGSGNYAGIASAFRTLTTETEDPGPFTFTGTLRFGRAMTYAVRGPIAQAETGDKTGTGAQATVPSGIALSATAVPEDAAVGFAFATISADGTAPVAFAIAADPDGKFAIVGAELRLAAALDHETRAAHQVTISATNAAGHYDETFTIAVTDVVEATAPTGIALSATSVPEDAQVGAIIAIISADSEAVFSLVA